MATRDCRLLAVTLSIVLICMGAHAQGDYRLMTVDRASNLLRTIDPVTGTTLASVGITLPGYAVLSGSGLVKDPTSDILYALVVVQDGGTTARLVKLDPATGLASDIGPASDGSAITFTAIAFSTEGTLFAVAAATPHTLFTLDKNSGQAMPYMSLLLAGAALAFDPDNHLLYHVGDLNEYEVVDPSSSSNTPVKRWVGHDLRGITSEVHFRTNFLWAAADQSLQLGTQPMSNLDHVAGGMAFVGTPPACPADGGLYGIATGTKPYYGDTAEVLVALDPTTGAAQLIGPTGTRNMLGMDFGPNATLYAVTHNIWQNTLNSVDICSGSATGIGATLSSKEPAGDISIRNPDGTLFFTSGGALFTIDRVTAAPSLIGSTGQTGTGNALAFDSAGTLYFAPSGQLFTLDPATAAATPVAALGLPAGSVLTAMDADPTTGDMYALLVNGSGHNFLVKVDMATGSVTNVGETQGGLRALAFNSGTSPSEYTLTVVNSPGSGGTVSSDAGGVSCPPTCTATFPKGTSVSLAAYPDPGYAFGRGWGGWYGACSGNGDCTIRMDSDRTLWVSFDHVVTLTVDFAGTGTGMVWNTEEWFGGSSSGISVQVPWGDYINMYAVADTGSVFAGWSGDCEGVTGPSNNECWGHYTSDASFTVTFNALASYGLSVTRTGAGNGTVNSSDGKINCGTTCTATYYEGQTAALTATSAPGSAFSGWTGACTGTAICYVSMSSAKSVAATFDVAPPDSTAPTVAITSHSSGSVVSGTSVALTASASDDVGVIGVQFKLDGANLDAEDTTEPYSVVWDSTRTTNGTHTLAVSAHDAAGNVGMATAVAVMVANSTDFQLTPEPGSPTTVTIPAGGTATYKLYVAPTAGFTGPVSFTCTGAPPGSTCSVSPNPATVSGKAPTEITVTVTTPPHASASSAADTGGGSPRGVLTWATLLLTGMILLPAIQMRKRAAPLAIAILLAVLVLSGCGGRGAGFGPSGGGGTPPSTYALTVSGSAGSVTHTFHLTLTVN